MTSTLAVRPLLFDPAFEQIPPDEEQTARELTAVLHDISDTTYRHYGHAVRSVHAKSHGLLLGELEVLEGLPPELAQGAFARAGKFATVLRFSTNPGDLLDDSVSTPRGLALKMIGVEGERLPGSEGHLTQDFVMINAPAFGAATPKAFLGTLKLLAKTTDKMHGLKKALSAVLRGAETVVEAFGGESGTLKSLGGHPQTHILGETFYTAVPCLYGPYFAKLCVVPVSPALTALADAPLDVTGKPNGLRDAVGLFFAMQGGEWDVRVQLATEIAKMPIENAALRWPEAVSPYATVARLRVAPQPAWSEARVAALDDGMAFSPWHGLSAHRPLGGIMRVRKPAYEMSSQFRRERNRCPLDEPRARINLSE